MKAKVIETNEIIYDAVEYEFDYGEYRVKGRNDKGEYVEYEAREVIMLPSEMQEKSIDWERLEIQTAAKIFAANCDTHFVCDGQFLREHCCDAAHYFIEYAKERYDNYGSKGNKDGRENL